eukprot:GHVH01001631.1.p1 GENE.GHVH01001631.1~~GHVH01001631.1.p1  ORF type:complete len:185 (+),score=32.82 GHVH01001631.1:50-556(+)
MEPSSRQEDLNGYIDLQKSEGLNTDDWKSGFCQPNLDLEIKSDCDPELLFNLQFKGSVRLSGIALQINGRIFDEGSYPTELKLVANKPPLGFDDVEHVLMECVKFSIDDIKSGRVQELMTARYHSVTSLSIYIEGDGDRCEHTCLSRIRILGQPNQCMDMNDWKPTKG